MPVARRLDHGQRDRGGQCGIDGIATARQHRKARLRGQRLRCRHDIVGKDGRPPRGIYRIVTHLHGLMSPLVGVLRDIAARAGG